MIEISWDDKASSQLRKLPKEMVKRILLKIEKEIVAKPERHLETLVGVDFFKIRIGNYRLFVDYNKLQQKIIIRSLKHRREAYKKHFL